MQQGNSPSYKLPVFVSIQAGDKGMRLFQENTATPPWRRLLVVLYSPSVQQAENCVATSCVLDLSLDCAHASRFPLLIGLIQLINKGILFSHPKDIPKWTGQSWTQNAMMSHQLHHHHRCGSPSQMVVYHWRIFAKSNCCELKYGTFFTINVCDCAH